MCYICPICQTPLIQHLQSKGYFCKNKHHFDRAKEGYINLLPVQFKKTKNPGDSRAMMRSRRHFLEAGFYQPLAQAITSMIDNHHKTESSLKILDMGCGEGYYCRKIEAFSQVTNQLELHGMDIAKNAILAAAKKQPSAHFIVASSNQMPYADLYFDVLLKVCAPANETEISRLLKTQGQYLLVTPGPRHLWQLKQHIYKQVNHHNPQVELPQGFEQIDQQTIKHTIKPNQEHRMALLEMTPFAWRAKGKIKDNIHQAQELEIDTEFILTLAEKKSG